MHWIYLIHEFHNLSWITEINELLHDILIYWDAPVLYTKYKAENNALWTIYVKYDLKIYREVWKFESGKVWNFEMENV